MTDAFYTDDEFRTDDPTPQNGPKALREAYEKQGKELAELKTQLQELLERDRKREQETLLADFDPKVVELAAKWGDPKDFVEKFGDILPKKGNPQPQVTQEQPQVDPYAELAAQFTQLQNTSAGAESAPRVDSAALDALQKAAMSNDPNAITQLMKAHGLAR